MLRDLLQHNYDIPDYLVWSEASPIPLTRMNQENWIELSRKFRRSFRIEAEFRTHFTDYLLTALGDSSELHWECRCSAPGIPSSFVDNVIRLNGKYLLVEIKLAVPTAARQDRLTGGQPKGNLHQN